MNKEKEEFTQKISVLEKENEDFYTKLKISQQKVKELSDTLTEKMENIKDLLHQLNTEISLKNQALEDHEIMSDIYKDFESREVELTNKEKQLKWYE